MDKEMICLECSWIGNEKELAPNKVAPVYLGPNEVCPNCGSDHVDYVERIKRGVLNGKTKD